MSLSNTNKMESEMPEKLNRDLRRKVWFGIIILLSLLWGGITYLIAHFFS